MLPEPFKVKVLNTGGLSGELANAFNINQNPVWTKAREQLEVAFKEKRLSFLLSYPGVAQLSEVTSVLAGVGLTLNTFNWSN